MCWLTMRLHLNPTTKPQGHISASPCQILRNVLQALCLSFLHSDMHPQGQNCLVFPLQDMGHNTCTLFTMYVQAVSTLSFRHASLLAHLQGPQISHALCWSTCETELLESLNTQVTMAALTLSSMTLFRPNAYTVCACFTMK